MISEEHFISAADFADRMEKQLKMAEMLIAGHPDSITPQLWIETLNQKGERGSILCALVVPFNEDREKQKALAGMGAMVIGENKVPVAVFLTSEAWKAPDSPSVEPRYHPEKQEGVLISGISICRRHCSIIFLPVSRDEAGKIESAGIPERGDQQGRHAEMPLLHHFYRGVFIKAASDLAHWCA